MNNNYKEKVSQLPLELH